MHIPPSELQRHPFSFGDPNGSLFSWNGDLYRGINAGHASFSRRLFADGIVDELVAGGLLIDTELTALAADRFDLVLKHRRLPFVTYPFEWPPEMLRAAALHVIDLQRTLLARGLTLQDGHSWNVLWEGSRPVFVDFGSIVPLDLDLWNTYYTEFCEFFLFPLRCMAAGHIRATRSLMFDFVRGISAAEAERLGAVVPLAWSAKKLSNRVRERVAPLLPSRVRKAIKQLITRPSTPVTLDRMLIELRDEIVSLDIPVEPGIWANYYEAFPPLDRCPEWSDKQRVVQAVLAEAKPATVLDIGSNRGWFAQLAGRYSSEVVAFDTDEFCANQLWIEAHATGANVQSLVGSFLNPSPGLGVSNGFAAPATERLRSDLVLALALTHHLVFKHCLRFDQIADGLAHFCRRGLIVEFVPRDDQYVAQWMTERHEWYQLPLFIQALKRHFPDITVHSSHPPPRVLLVCRR